MATIAFLIDAEEGHFIPTLGIAQSLKKKGHEITYLGIADCEAPILERGFLYSVIATNDYPPGYVQQCKEIQSRGGMIRRLHYLYSIAGEIKDFITEHKPQLFAVSTFLTFEAVLIQQLFSMKVIIITPYLLSDSTPETECSNTIQSIYSQFGYRVLKDHLYDIGFPVTYQEVLRDFMPYLGSLTEVVTCPNEFDFPGTLLRKNVIYAGPSLFEDELSYRDALAHIPHQQKIIYAAMGSQTTRFREKCDYLYRLLIEIIADPELSDFHLVLSIGDFSIISATDLPPNATILTWAPQTEILKRAAIMINHGGLGTIKECIYYGVPMIVVPDKYDQPINANRVVFHRLGYKIAFEELTHGKLKGLLVDVVDNESIRIGMDRMQAIFQTREKMQIGSEVVENVLKK